ISFTIEPFEDFSVKKTTNRILPKTASDIQSYAVYLVTHRTFGASYPLNGDPLGAGLVSGPFYLNKSGAIPHKVTFENLLPNISDDYYYHVAVRAFDGKVING